MAARYIPVVLRHVPMPGVRAFAILAAVDAAVRATLVSVWPIVMYRALQDAAAVSRAYFLVGLGALVIGLMVPWAGRFIPRRWLYTLGGCLYLAGPLLAMSGVPALVPFAYLVNCAATVTIFINLNAYVMDYISRPELGRGEQMKMFYSAFAWSGGPVLGVTLLNIWPPLPFLLAQVFALVLLAVFWRLRLGNGKQISRARRPAPNPLAYLSRFLHQPRLVTGWIFAVVRSCGWWVYVVYLPIFCIEAGLGDRLGGIIFSFSNALAFLTPLMLRGMQHAGVRGTVRVGFAGAALAFGLAGLAGLMGAWPPVAVAALFAATFFLVLLDMSGGLPFLMAVKPSERAEMAAVYSSFRDVSGIVTPGVAWIVLLVAPIPGIFAACGAGMAATFALAGRLHPRLGERH
ncbi:MFS transporter [Frigidibacter oleivorans]|uniref:MFS transporter n=1 Tax=Frigidibacter oleivorans TaxID=2487129 RepID=UPI000F8D0AAB|nr:MFS transporter [Frigidibacter oleivorans]